MDRASVASLLRLERAIVLTFLAHGLAMVGMALVLAPMLPGGGDLPDAARVALIAEHPWRFRLGWLPWHLTALSDVWLAVAVVLERRIARPWAWVAALLTLLAVLPDQGGQLSWITRGVQLARQATARGDLTAYLAYEDEVFRWTAAYAAFLYTLASIAWSLGFASAGLWSRALTRLAVPLWSGFVAITLAPLLPPSLRPSPLAIAAGNALAFVGLELWLWLVGEQVMRRTRASTEYGRWAPWRSPWGGARGVAADTLANSRFLRSLCEFLPTPSFRSDITDVLYVNYLVPAERLRPLVPAGLELQTLGPGYAMFSLLTYRHGHFGPGLLGPLRVLFPSPVQSNWRVYVRDPRTGKEGISFVTNTVTTTLHALGARLMSDGAPMHRAASAQLARDDAGRVSMEVDPGPGSAPDLLLDLRPTDERGLHGAWAECFADYTAMLAYTVPQDRAMETQPWRGTTSRDEIHLGIPLTSCEPLAGRVTSRAVAPIVGDAEPLCFRVPSVSFRLDGEQLDRW